MNSNEKKTNKLILGTVQFGLKYGINNSNGILEDDELVEVLKLASVNEINFLDTAAVYGNSENRIGKLEKSLLQKFNLITKTPTAVNCSTIEKEFENSLTRLGKSKIYGYLIHHFKDYLNEKKIFANIEKLKAENKINKIGFSLYHPKELEMIIDDRISFDIVQIPFNLADRRFEKYFESLKKINVEIHTRSVFLQGLFFCNLKKISGKLAPFIPWIEKLQNLCNENKILVEDLALNFELQNKFIDKIVIGIDNQMQLKKNIDFCSSKISQAIIEDILKDLEKIKIPNELLLPINWN